MIFRSVDMEIAPHQAKSSQITPKWHPASGAKGWVFVDEILLN